MTRSAWMPVLISERIYQARSLMFQRSDRFRFFLASAGRGGYHSFRSFFNAHIRNNCVLAMPLRKIVAVMERIA